MSQRQSGRAPTWYLRQLRGGCHSQQSVEQSYDSAQQTMNSTQIMSSANENRLSLSCIAAVTYLRKTWTIIRQYTCDC